MRYKIPLLLVLAALVLVPVFMAGAGTIKSELEISVPNLADSSGVTGYADSAGTVTDETLDYTKIDPFERARLGLVPAGDTLFHTRYNTGSDSGHAIVLIDELGDSLAIIRYSHQAKTGANRGWGGVAGGLNAYTQPPHLKNAPQMMCTDYEYVAPIREAGLCAFWNGAGDGAITHVDTAQTIVTNECIQYQDSWTWNFEISAEDTLFLEIERTLTAWRNMPGFVVRYKMRSDEWAKDGDTLRFVIAEDPCLGGDSLAVNMTAETYTHDVGWVPGYGEVRRNHVFTDFPVPVAAMLNIGNVQAAMDTIDDGSSSYMSDSLKYDFGSGTKSFVGTWLAFNPSGAQIETIAFADTSVSWDRLEYDSTMTLYSNGSMDSASVLDGITGGSPSSLRCIYMRTEPLYLDTVNWTTIEYAVGRVYFLADTSPIQISIPDIYWTDGTVTRIDTGTRR